ncbi:MAG: SDR family NAD(P)-dependent oxidoreductase [Rhodobacter sp.]|nr:SDR family NAD(P)-dependent oxidoreductase [Rhodobacter sp.]
MSAEKKQGDIAIVGLAVRLPGGQENAETYWRNLRDGICSIRRFDKDVLEEAGVPPHLLARPDYVPFAAPLDRFDHFDAEFFGLSPKEAAIMDPQHRQFLELSWEALERAGHVPSSFDGKVGVYAGCGMGSYFYFNVCSNPDLVEDTGMFLLRHTGNDKDFLSTRVSHALDLKGPSVNVQTACSTSLVAVHYAAQALASGECDMALAGGATIELPQGHGYVYKENEILSPDGQCRAFDHRAEGTVFGSGAGVVALRRLEDAVRDGDPILAVIKGSAINNDGADKAGYLAPSVSGQAKAVAAAHKAAGVSAETIDYVECHGTGTYLGDPIEVAALTEAFRETTDAEGFCRIGSVKTNIGHLDTAAGIASLGKAALALQHGEIPPTLGFEAPNPAIDFETSPFRVNDRLTPWPTRDHPRRAGVNSLGVGGTNAHVVLEEAPEALPSEDSGWPFQLLTLSARSEAALDAAADRLADHLEAHPEQPLADVAFTLKEGRHGFDKRRVVVAESHAEAARLLRECPQHRVFSQSTVAETPDTVFMFPGGGAQYAGMARDLYDTEPVFREWMDTGLDHLQPKLDDDVRAVWLPGEGDLDAADARLKTPSVQLPLIMIVEYALAQLWISWGVKPAALIGHSMGENTAACLAGVMSFEDCIGLVHLRGRLFDTVPAGGMLSVPLSEAELRPYLGDDLDIAAINAPSLTVATGPEMALAALEARLAAADIEGTRIAIDIAAHSRMLEPILDDFRAYLQSIALHAPALPFVSNVTGTWITEAEATDPDYWVRHLRGMVRFADGIDTLAETQDRIFLEVGPGRAMVALAAQNPKVTRKRVMGTLRDPADKVGDDVYFVTMLGRHWAMGGSFDWSQIWEGARRRRVSLPTYPFQQKRYFIEPGTARAPDTAEAWPMRIEDSAKWSWTPVWKPTYADCPIDVTEGLAAATPETWLVLLDETGLGKTLVTSLRDAGHRVITVRAADRYRRIDADTFGLAPRFADAEFPRLLSELAAEKALPSRVLHLWLVTDRETDVSTLRAYHQIQDKGFWSLFHFSRAWAEADGKGLHLHVITSDMMRVGREPLPYPAKATVLGPAKVIPREFPGLMVAILDIESPAIRAPSKDMLLEDILAHPGNHVAALRGGKRLQQGWQPVTLGAPDLTLREGATVLMTGGLGGIGLTLAERLMRDHGAKIAFVSRQALPPRAKWDSTLRQTPPGDPLADRLNLLMHLEAQGGQFRTFAADVANHEQMRGVVDAIEQDWGPVSGVVHAAGAIDDGPILGKSKAQIDRVLAAKVFGTNVLLDLFPDGSLDWMALFSSSSTITAPAGQVDYVAANDYLNAVAQSRAGGKTRVFAINWGVWAEVGMAARAVAARQGGGTEGALLAVDQPLLDGIASDVDGTRTYVARWRTDEQWVLDEHRTRAGDALLPGTGYLELAAQALTAAGHDSAFEISDLTFLSPLRVEDGGVTDVRVTLTKSPDRYRMEVTSALDGKSFEPNAEARLQVLSMIPPASLDIAAIAARCPDRTTAAPGETLATAQEAHLIFGPRWQVLEETRFGNGEGLARLRLPAGDTAYHLHPGLMDIATGWAMELIDGYDPATLWVPVSYRSARFFGAIPTELRSWVRLVSQEDGIARFDITLTAPDGVICADIEGFTIHRLASETAFAAAPSRVRPVAAQTALSPAEERLHHSVRQGIPPADGAGLFLTALGAGLPQLAISSLDLEALIRQAAQDAKPRSGVGQSFERPDLDSPFVAPEGEIEQRLARIWSDLLGVDEIGAEDDFMDLGGHSLIAVRMFAQVKSAFSVDFPISVLFQAPTIRKVAALIAEQVGEIAPVDSPEGARQGFDYLVLMHDDDGPQLPFFLVAGMHGNVLNFRGLTQPLDWKGPVWGLQAKGLVGDDTPHETIEEAARSYIEEIRRVRPKGPYLLGGYSGGGITALEMAHQLEAAGDDVAAVLLIDTPLPTPQELDFSVKLRLHLHRLLREKFRYPVLQMARWKQEHPLGHEAREDESIGRQIGRYFTAAVRQYTAKRWTGSVTLFRPPLIWEWDFGKGVLIDKEHRYVRNDNMWGDLLPDLDVVEVPGDHVSMVLEPNASVLAAHMRAAMAAADREARLKQLWDKKAAE